MTGYKRYTITWEEEHSKIVCSTSEINALIDAKISSGNYYTCIKSKNFKSEE